VRIISREEMVKKMIIIVGEKNTFGGLEETSLLSIIMVQAFC